MEATAQPATGSAQNDRWQMLGGDRFYTLTRWIALALLIAISRLLTNEPIWPPLASSSPITLLVWGYTLFSLLTTAALFVHALGSLLRVAFAVDIAVITLLTYFNLNKDQPGLFYPLYVLPLVSIAMRMRPSRGVLTGLLTALAYAAASVGARIGADNGSIPRDTLGIVAISLQGAALVFIPWLTSGLAERWHAANRRSIALAEQKTQDALGEANAYRDQMRALYEVAYTLSTTMNYQSVLDSALIESRRLVPHSCSLVLLSTGQPDELYVAAGYGLREADFTSHVRVGLGRVGQALRAAEPVLLADVSAEEELRPISALATCRATCIVPLRAGLRTYGVMLVAGDREQLFSPEQLGMVTALANYAIIALHNAQLIQDLREERTKLLSKEEEVRRQLARDLHDGPAQALAAITMGLEFVKRLLERDPGRVVAELDKLANLSKRTTHEVRTMLFELRPLVLETQGLDVTLRQYFERFQSDGMQIILEMGEINAHLDTKVEGTLFNIIQESVNNALKHARAQHIWVRLKQTPTALEATVQDDGRGFDLQKVLASYEQRGSFGLLNIEERAKLIGGMAELHSAPGEGTTVHVIMPLN